MQYTVNRGEKGKIEIKVDIPKADFGKAYDEMIGVLGKDTKVEGFRPGNVPKDILEGKVGTNKILNETASFLISQHLSEIFKKENIVPVGNPAVAVGSLARDLPFSFTATVISKPKVKVGDWKKIRVKKVAAKGIAEKDVEESIKNIYEAWGKNSKFKNSPRFSGEAGQKPEVEEDRESADNDESSKKFIYDAHGEKIFLKDDEKGKSSFASSFAGASAGDKSLADRSDDKQAPEGQVDDEFAKAIGARDLAHLREIVRKDLEQIVADQVEAKLENEIFEEFLKISEVEVPDLLVDDEVNRIMIRLNSQLEQQGRKLEDYLREQNTTLEALRAKFRPQAEKNVKVTLIMDEIGKSERIQITPEEIDNALKNVNQTGLSSEQQRDLEQYLTVSIFQAKTLELVKKAVAS